MADFAGGSGTKEDPYLIETREHWENMNSYKKNNHFKLMNDIDFGGKNYTPIGDHEDNFESCFDGNGFTIKNITIDASTIDETKNAAIFCYIFDDSLESKIYFKDLTIENITIDNYGISSRSYRAYAALFIGGSFETFDEDVLISNITVENGEIYSYGAEGHFPTVSGLIASHWQYYDNETVIENCETDVKIYMENEQPQYASGILATGGGHDDSIIIVDNCHANTEYVDNGVTRYRDLKGGFISYLMIYGNCTINFKDCSAEGKVFGDHAVGGFGCLETFDPGSTAILANCYSRTDVIIKGDASDYFGVFGAFSTWDFDENDLIRFKNCYAIGSITQEGTDVPYAVAGFNGGFSHGSGPVVYENCYSAVEMDLNGYEDTAKFACDSEEIGGYNKVYEETQDCYFNDEILPDENLVENEHGQPRTTDEMTDPYADNTYEDWDMQNIWNDTTKEGYPHFGQETPLYLEITELVQNKDNNELTIEFARKE